MLYRHINLTTYLVQTKIIRSILQTILSDQILHGFPSALTDFIAYKNNPVFAGTGTDTWDQKIRERGYILREDGMYYMWYTGYKGDEAVEKHLGLATSTDGLSGPDIRIIPFTIQAGLRICQ